MREPVFTGACPAIVTPFDANGAVNYDAFGKLIDQQVAAGVDAICVCGTTGETSTLSIREHIAVVEYCVKRVNHRVKVIAGAGSNDTSAAVYLSQHAQDYGADALLHVTPYYNKASQSGLIEHYLTIADNVDIPIIVYNVPSRTGMNLLPETMLELAKHPLLCAFKDANTSMAQSMRLFCIPGCAHGGGKGRILTGSPSGLQMRQLLVAWCERGQAPEKITAKDRGGADMLVAPYPGLYYQDAAGEWKLRRQPRSAPCIDESCLKTKTKGFK